MSPALIDTILVDVVVFSSKSEAVKHRAHRGGQRLRFNCSGDQLLKFACPILEIRPIEGEQKHSPLACELAGTSEQPFR